MLSPESPPIETAAATELPSRVYRSPSIGGSVVPNLVVIGAMKASTTTFYELITRHPDIWFSAEKEPHYFTLPQYGEPTAWEAYLKHFEDAPADAKYVGEASTGYSKLPHFGNTAERLREDLRQPRLIYLVRDPVERVISNYQHSYLSGFYSAGMTLGEAMLADPILVDGSCYARQVRAYREVFGCDGLLILATDELHFETTGVMRRVESFLDLPAYDGWEAPLPQSNSKQALRRSLWLRSILPRPLLDSLRRVIPSGVRERLQTLATSRPTLPPIDDADREMVFEKIADDLQDFLTLVDSSLSAWVTTWPSAKKLIGR